MFTINDAEVLQVTGLLYVYGFVFLYCMCLFAASRERLYLMQGLFSLALMFNTMVSSAIMTIWGLVIFQPDNNGFIPAWPWFVCASGTLLLLTALLLFRDFTLSKVYFPRIDRALKVMALVLVPLELVLLLLAPGLAVGAINLAGLVLVPFFIALSILAAKKGHQEAIFQLLTFSLFLVVTILYTLGPLVSDMLAMASRLVFYYGAAASLVLLSFGIARRINTLKTERERIKDLFGAYVSSQVVNQILHKQINWEGEERIATVLFTDIRNYTAMAEHLPPRDVIRVLNEYYSVLVDIVNRHKGIVNKFMGDSIMALFNVPLDQPDHATQAIEAGREILLQTSMQTFGATGRPAPNQSQQSGQQNPDAGSDGGGLILRTNVGIHTGRVVVGNVGSSSRLEYSVMGDTVNIASRLEQLNKEFNTPLLLSGETAGLYGKTDTLRLVREDLVIRGRVQPCSVYTLAD